MFPRLVEEECSDLISERGGDLLGDTRGGDLYESYKQYQKFIRSQT